MTIHLPKDVESSIAAAVHGGLFASADEALAEAWRCLLGQRIKSHAVTSHADAAPDPLLGSVGAMQDAADELEESVADATKQRQASTMPPANGAAGVALGHKPIWERAAELSESIPAEEWDKLPVDGARQLKHYLYGSPKRPTA